jgi:hypothetical protein
LFIRKKKVKVESIKKMIVWLGVAAAAFLFYKWATNNNDYFEKRGVKFMKPTFLLGSHATMFFEKKSLPDMVCKWYDTNGLCDEK